MGDDGGLGALTGLLNLGAGGVNLLMRGAQQVPRIVRQAPRVVRVAGDAFNRLPKPVQQSVLGTLEYGPPVFDFARSVASGQDPLRAATEIVSGEVTGRTMRRGAKNPIMFAVRDVVGNITGQGLSRAGTDFGVRMGQQPTETAPSPVDPTMPEWRRAYEQGY